MAHLAPAWLIVILLVLFALGHAFFVWSQVILARFRPGQVEEEAENKEAAAPLLALLRDHRRAALMTQGGALVCALAAAWPGLALVEMIGQALPVSESLSQSLWMQRAGLSFGFLLWVVAFSVGFHLMPARAARKARLPMALWTGRMLRPLWKFCFFRNGHGDAEAPGNGEGAKQEQTETSHGEDLHSLLAENHPGGPISSIGREILINTLELSERVTRDIMTPRNEVVYLDLNRSFDENLQTAVESKYTRFPLCQEHLDNPIGLVHIKDLIPLIRQESPRLTQIKRELIPVSELMPLEKLLALFLARHAHLALVVDEYGGTVGIVTLDNVMEELVGDIQDEFDSADEEFKRLGPDEFLAKGTLGLHELEDVSDLDLSHTEVSTVGGYVTHKIGHLPEQGEKVEIEDYSATVTQTDGRRVLMVHFKRSPRKEPAETELSDETGS